MRLAAIDTSNQAMSLALVDNRKLVSERITTTKRNHSVQLMPTLSEMMEEAEWEVADLDRIAVAKGPGSYTGIRIGVTVAKTLAWTAGLELVGISSLKILAGNADRTEGQLIAPVFDARRGNIYAGLYEVNKTGGVDQIEADTHISAEKWVHFLSAKKQLINVVGQDFYKHQTLFETTLKNYLKRSPVQNQVPRASVLAEFAYREEPVNIHTFSPEYIKLAEAEENWRKAHPEHKGDNFVEKIEAVDSK